jgi:hypothetical protein
MSCGVLHCQYFLLFTHVPAGTDIEALGCNVIEAIRQKFSLSVSIWTENWKPIKYAVQLNQHDEASLGGWEGRGDCI